LHLVDIEMVSDDEDDETDQEEGQDFCQGEDK